MLYVIDGSLLYQRIPLESKQLRLSGIGKKMDSQNEGLT